MRHPTPSFLGGIGGHDIVPFLGKVEFENRTDVLFVIDNKNSGTHLKKLNQLR